jgi:phage terminase large subunit-like protein
VTAERRSGVVTVPADPNAYLLKFDKRLLLDPEGRRKITKFDPLAFALIYCRHHLRGDETGGEITLSEFHEEVCADALLWARKAHEPRENRRAYVAPRACGKSTWFFLILPLWAAAHGHKKFAAAFAHSATQAQNHLATFRHELDTNELLQKDYPALCRSAKRSADDLKLADNRSMIRQGNGFVFSANGMDSGNLGMKVGERRPDLIVMDDIEPGEDQYSPGQAEGRLKTLTDVILPLNDYATVVVVGTVTMPGSIIHQLVRTVTTSDEPEEWIVSERFKCRYFPAILLNDDGTERSVWPAKWPIEYLTSIRRTRSFLKNMQNDPMGVDGIFWSMEVFSYGALTAPTHTILAIDPAVTTKQASDFTGLAVVQWDRASNKCCVLHAEEVKLTGEALRTKVLATLAAFPEIIGVIVETNQGGDHWHAILHDLPVKLKTKHNTVNKEVRAGQLLNHYQRGRVLHARPLVRLEQQMVSFPKVPHDDLVDAVGVGCDYFLGHQPKKTAIVAKQMSYA